MSQQYSSNNPGTIIAQFSLEGDALNRAGFKEPDMSLKPEELRTGYRPAHLGISDVALEGYSTSLKPDEPANES